MGPIANDRASPSSLPEIPSMPLIMLASCLYGFLSTAQTMILYVSGWLRGDGTDAEAYRDAVVYLQVSIAIEFLIFSCRTPGFVLGAICNSARPSLALTVAVFGANILVSVMAGFGVIIHKVEWIDIAWIWAYDVAWLLGIDALKWFLRAIGFAWMSAGASGGVLEYAELPEDPRNSGSTHRSQFASNAPSVRSVLTTSRASMQHSSSALGRSGGSHVSVRANSILPFPHNLRAAALHQGNSC